MRISLSMKISLLMKISGFIVHLFYCGLSLMTFPKANLSKQFTVSNFT